MDFEQLARTELKGGATPYETQCLLEHPAEWHVALLRLSDSVDEQSRKWKERINQANRDFQTGAISRSALNTLQVERVEWQNKGLHFQRLVISRAREVKLLRQGQYARLHELTTAIRQHYAETLTEDPDGTTFEPTKADLKLWAMVELHPDDFEQSELNWVPSAETG